MSASKYIRQNWATVATQITALIVALLKDFIVKIFKGVFGDTLSGVIYALILVAAFGLMFYLVNRALRPKPKDLVPRDAKPPRMRGLILLVGPGKDSKPPEKQSAPDAIKYHLRDAEGKPVLRYCWLIASPEAYPFAVELQNEFQPQGVDVRLVKVSNAFDLHGTFYAVSQIYSQELGKEQLSEDMVIADFTGATKHMSLGMALACIPYDRVMQYMMGGRPEIKSAPMLVKFGQRVG